MGLQEKALLSKLTITEWRDQVTDEIVTTEIAEKYGLKNKRDRYIKALLPAFALDVVRSSVFRIRAYHRKTTLPWYDDNIRVLASDMVMEYQQHMFELRSHFEAAVDEFVKGYPKFIEMAKVEKGTLFDESQYPDVDTVKSRFSMKLLLMPFPNTDDFRIDVDENELARIKEEADHAIKVAMRNISSHLIDKITDSMTRSRRLNTLLDTLDMAERMNISNDKYVSESITSVREAVAGVGTNGMKDMEDVLSKLAATIKAGAAIR